MSWQIISAIALIILAIVAIIKKVETRIAPARRLRNVRSCRSPDGGLPVFY